MTCEKCGKEHDGKFGSGRFCSRRCSSAFSAVHADPKNISNGLKGKTHWYKDGRCSKILVCESCGAKLRNRPRKYLKCVKCLKSDPAYIKNLSKSLKGKTGGYRPNSGWGKFKKSRYRGTWMDSSWETQFAERLDRLKIRWTRGKHHIPYATLDGTAHKYYPDFYIVDKDEFVEISGYPIGNKEEKLKLVIEQNPLINLIILRKLNEVKSYGE